MAQLLRPDICIIGGGPAGIAVALGAARRVSCVLVERRAPADFLPGRDASACGALLACARRAALARTGNELGVQVEAAIDYARIRDHMRQAATALAPNSSAARLAALGVRLVFGEARFRDRRTVAVGDRFEIRARRFVVATGASTAPPAIPGLERVPYILAEDVARLAELPRRPIIVGAGAIGMALAQAFQRLGSQVTVLDTAAPLAEEDAECAAVVVTQLEREGVAIRRAAKFGNVRGDAAGVSVTIETSEGEETIEGTHLLLATDRKAAVEGLDLTAARVRYSDAGIAVSPALRTRNRRVYAVGDVVAGQPRSMQAAEHHASVVIRNLLFAQRARLEVIPRVAFTEPSLAHVGITEAEARKRRLRFRILRWPYHDNARAHAERMSEGHIKVLVGRSGRILGATIVGAQAEEMIAIWSLAIARRLNIDALAGVVVPYPTFSDVSKRAAVAFLFTPGLLRSMLRRAVARLRISG
ncbi:MAG: FAD-dependent oxidoreductase [Pseudolabrys sp.]|nr:FAD-dependent oxidoreductase [Pseudolabrys sp.]